MFININKAIKLYLYVIEPKKCCRFCLLPEKNRKKPNTKNDQWFGQQMGKRTTLKCNREIYLFSLHKDKKKRKRVEHASSSRSGVSKTNRQRNKNKQITKKRFWTTRKQSGGKNINQNVNMREGERERPFYQWERSGNGLI